MANDLTHTLPSSRASAASGDDRATPAEIAKLLLHFYAPSISAAANSSLAADWVFDLREFGRNLITGACLERRRESTRRPTIADIRGLCIAQQHAAGEHQQLLAYHGEIWPQEMVKLWGPWPEGARRRSAELAKQKEKAAAITASLSARSISNPPARSYEIGEATAEEIGADSVTAIPP
jgi:hypothetical protein